MRVVLTGATGTIGQALGRRLVERGHSVTAVTREPMTARPRLSFPAEVIAWSDHERLERAIGLAEAVVHLAGESVGEGRWTRARKESIRSSRVDTTEQLSRLIMKSVAQLDSRRPPAFVLGSAVGFYGNSGSEVCGEDSPKGGGFLADVVADWEAAGLSVESVGGRLVRVRTGVVLDTQSGVLGKMLGLFRNGMGGVVGSGQQYISWIHIKDCVEVFVQAIEQPWTGVVNAVSPEPVTNRQWTESLARHLQVLALAPAPEFALRLALGEQSALALDSTRVEPGFLKKAKHQFVFPDIDSALADLVGPLAGGLQELIAAQWVPRLPGQVWDYFSDEKNLEELTPPFLGFSVRKKSTAKIERGTLIDYRLRLHGLPISWRTEISKWDPPREFVDEQLRGPYSRWHHTHQFTELGGGTLLHDRVLYRLPLGLVGRLFAGWKVESDVAKIFAYRRQQIASRFGTT